MVLLPLCFLLCIIQTITLSHPSGNDFYLKNPGSVDVPQEKPSNRIVNLVKRGGSQVMELKQEEKELDHSVDVERMQGYLQPLDPFLLGPDVINHAIANALPNGLQMFYEAGHRPDDSERENIEIGLEGFIDPITTDKFYQDMFQNFRNQFPKQLDDDIDISCGMFSVEYKPNRLTLLLKKLKDDQRKKLKDDLINGILESTSNEAHDLLNALTYKVYNACFDTIMEKFDPISASLHPVCKYIELEFDKTVFQQYNQMVQGELKNVVTERITNFFNSAF